MQNLFCCECHLPGYNYCGPGTNLDEKLRLRVKPINRIDNLCKIHDINYYLASKGFKSYREADEELLNDIKNLENLTYCEYIAKLIIIPCIGLKLFLNFTD